MDTTDYGPNPYIVNIENETLANDKFRVAKWTGEHLQMTVMAIEVGGEVGLEQHATHDQFLRIEQGEARVVMGETKDDLSFDRTAKDDDAIFVPAGMWHNIINIGDTPLKLYSIYGPAEHDHGTVHTTYQDDPEH